MVLATAILMSVIPFLTEFILFLAVNLLVGVTSGAAISLCESWILEIWGNQCGPYMQALQFFRGLGYIIAPVLANPFLSIHEELDQEELNNGIMANGTTEVYDKTSTTPESHYNDRIRTPYIVNGVMLAVGAAFLLCMYIFRVIKDNQSNSMSAGISQVKIISNSVNSLGDAKTEQPVVVQDKDGHGESVVVSTRARYFGYGIVALSSVFYLFFYEEVIVIFLPTFEINLDLNISKSQASLLTTAFSLSNVIGKACGVLLALKISHFILLYINLGIMIGSLVVIILFGNTNLTILWIAICIHGMFLLLVPDGAESSYCVEGMN